MHSKEQAERRQQYLAHLPWWRKPLWGYLLALPLIAFEHAHPAALRTPGYTACFCYAPVFLVTLLIAWIWGTGPAIVAIVLGALALNYFFLSPHGSLTWQWSDTLPMSLLLVCSAHTRGDSLST